MKDIATGINYIHSSGVIHRDIKIDNVILKHGVYKITDFGVSSVGEFSQTFVGTPAYLAPEIMNNRVYNDNYDKTVDIWALGVLAFQAYFEVIMDNMITICTPKFDIKNVITKLRKEKLIKEADFIIRKLQKTSKHLMYIFSKFFEFDP
jgi:serine/threonine protein kinase